MTPAQTPPGADVAGVVAGLAKGLSAAQREALEASHPTRHHSAQALGHFTAVAALVRKGLLLKRDRFLGGGITRTELGSQVLAHLAAGAPR